MLPSSTFSCVKKGYNYKQSTGHIFVGRHQSLSIEHYIHFRNVFLKCLFKCILNTIAVFILRWLNHPIVQNGFSEVLSVDITTIKIRQTNNLLYIFLSSIYACCRGKNLNIWLTIPKYCPNKSKTKLWEYKMKRTIEFSSRTSLPEIISETLLLYLIA